MLLLPNYLMNTPYSCFADHRGKSSDVIAIGLRRQRNRRDVHQIPRCHPTSCNSAIGMVLDQSDISVVRVPPPREHLRLYNGRLSPTEQSAEALQSVPRGFIDAMVVREEVYVKEQKVPLDNELDEDDEKSWHWVAYVKDKSGGSKPEPVGTIRLVPPPHPAHPSGGFGTAVHDEREPYVKLGRLAVLPMYRGAGIARPLVENTVTFVRENTAEIVPSLDGTFDHSSNQTSNESSQSANPFRGLILAHAQTVVQKFWRKYGFVTDESMGEWDEEGIDHVGMWLRT